MSFYLIKYSKSFLFWRAKLELFTSKQFLRKRLHNFLIDVLCNYFRIHYLLTALFGTILRQKIIFYTRCRFTKQQLLQQQKIETNFYTRCRFTKQQLLQQQKIELHLKQKQKRIISRTTPTTASYQAGKQYSISTSASQQRKWEIGAKKSKLL